MAKIFLILCFLLSPPVNACIFCYDDHDSDEHVEQIVAPPPSPSIEQATIIQLKAKIAEMEEQELLYRKYLSQLRIQNMALKAEIRELRNGT